LGFEAAKAGAALKREDLGFEPANKTDIKKYLQYSLLQQDNSGISHNNRHWSTNNNGNSRHG